MTANEWSYASEEGREQEIGCSVVIAQGDADKHARVANLRHSITGLQMPRATRDLRAYVERIERPRDV